MLGELLACEDVFPIRLNFGAALVVFFEGVDHQRAVDLYGFVVFRAVEHEPAAEAPRRSPVRLAKHGVGPHRGDFDGRLRLVGFTRFPRNRPVQIHLRASNRRCQQGRREKQA